jgi:hypothetical protein
MWAYALLHVTKQVNLLIRPDTQFSPVYMDFGKTPPWVEDLHSFGEKSIVKSTAKIQAKLKKILTMTSMIMRMKKTFHQL